jgi:hypothetical protein
LNFLSFGTENLLTSFGGLYTGRYRKVLERFFQGLLINRAMSSTNRTAAS